jgi:hypothetical protein
VARRKTSMPNKKHRCTTGKNRKIIRRRVFSATC